MTFAEIFYRLQEGLRPLAVYLIPITAITLAAAFILSFFTRKLWVGDRNWKRLGIFFSLNFKQRISLSCAWLKLVIMLLYLVILRELDTIHYFVLALTAVIMCIFSEPVSAVLEIFFWSFLELWAVFAANLVCSYYLTISSSAVVMAIYIFMSIFVLLLGVYRFIMETDLISESRTINPGKIWGSDNEEKSDSE